RGKKPRKPWLSPASSLITITSLPQTHEVSTYRIPLMADINMQAHITAIPSQVPQSKKTTSHYHHHLGHHHYSTIGGPTRPARNPNNLNDSDKGAYQCKLEDDATKTVAFEPSEYPREEDSHAYSVTTKEELLDWLKNGDQTYRNSLMPLDTRIRIRGCVLGLLGFKVPSLVYK
ncbi:hypothetical protein EDB85DRAFT_2185328, partial [Lactarius pseudohatsudake]